MVDILTMCISYLDALAELDMQPTMIVKKVPEMIAQKEKDGTVIPMLMRPQLH